MIALSGVVLSGCSPSPSTRWTAWRVWSSLIHMVTPSTLPKHVRPVRVVSLKRVPPQSRSEEPFVWRGAASDFRLMKWTNEVLLRASPPMLEVRRSPRPLFGPVFQEDRPLFGQPGVVKVDPAEKLLLPLQEVLNHMERPGPPFQYFNEDVLEQFPTLGDDIAELRPFVSTPEQCLVSLWIGQPGVAAYVHHDSYDNVFVQLRGRKRFVIAAPEGWRLLRPYPLLHPSHGQAQREALLPETIESTAAQAPVWMIDLEPGDILWVPPYAWHYVVSLTPSVSVNVWSRTPWAAQADAISGLAERTTTGRPRCLLDAWRRVLTVAPDALELLRCRYEALPPSKPLERHIVEGETAEMDDLLTTLRRVPRVGRLLLAADAAEVMACAALGPEQVAAAVALSI